MTPIELTLGQFRQLFSHIADASVQRYHAALSASALAYGIHTAQRLSAYVAQLDHESRGLTALEENLHYRAEQLLRLWPKRFKDLAEAQFYAEAGPEAIANRVYSGRMGNGDEASGDGYKYRARGPIGVTGHDNYAQAEKDTGLPLVTHPERLAEIESGCMAAAAFWKRSMCNQMSDHDDFDAISDAINIGHHTEKIGDANGYADRFKKWTNARQALGLPINGLL